MDDEEDDGLGRMVVLGRGRAENLKFDWMITDWSKCTQTCGGNGFQMRAAHCMVSYHLLITCFDRFTRFPPNNT